MTTHPHSPTADREIVLSRIFDAPRDLVFQAYTTPDSVAHWWGPRGFTITTHEMAVKPGGVWRFMMHGPDGTNYPNKIVYLEVKRPERLVFDHTEDVPNPTIRFHVTATFDEVSSPPPRTRLTLRMLFDTPAERDRVVKEYGAIEGGEQTLARLAEYLASLR